MESSPLESLTPETPEGSALALAKAREFVANFLAVVKNRQLFGDEHVTTVNCRNNLQKSQKIPKFELLKIPKKSQNSPKTPKSL